MKPYPKYKDSGVEWIGDVPEEWKVKKLKYLFSLITAKAPNGGRKIALENIESQTGRFIETETEFEGEGVKVRVNNLIYGKLRPYLAKVYIAEFEGAAVGDFFVLNGTSEVDSRYFLYKLLERNFTCLADSSTFGAKMPRVSWEFFADIFFAYPHFSEQAAIAAFLDRKTAEIDSLISNKERLIELYEEEKAAVINHAVTKGLDPDAKMKDSGVEWLGEIPEHWEVRRFKYVIESVTGGGTPSTENKEFWNGNIPWVSPKDMKVTHIYETEDYVTEKAVECSSTNLVPPERLLVVVRSGILKHSFPVAINKVAVCLNQDMKAIKPMNSIQLNFLFWKLKGTAGYILTQCNKIGATVDSIEIPALINFIITYPNVEEQTAIVEHIEAQCGHIDAIISKFKRQIELLKEYRTALISEAVTGKIDVRNE